MKTKGSRRRYMEMVNAKYSYFVHDMKKKLVFHAALEVLGLEVFVDSDRS